MIDAFNIGVRIGFSSNHGDVLGAIAREIGRLDQRVKGVNAEFDRMRSLAVGAAEAIAGFSTLRGLWQLTEAGKALNEELLRTQRLGGAFATNLPAIEAQAFRTSREVPTAAPDEVVKWMRELGTQLGNPQDAMGLATIVSKFAWLAEHTTGKDQGELVKDATRAIFDLGAAFKIGPDGREHADPEKFAQQLSYLFQAMTLGGGFLNGRDFLQFIRQAGPAGRMMAQQDPAAFWSQITEQMVALGASRAGTAEMSLFQQFAGGSMTRRTAEEMQRFGLLKDSEWRAEKGGHIVVDPQATARLADLVKSPFDFITNTLIPLMSKQGLSSDQMLTEVFRMFGRQTTQRLMAEMLQNNPQFARAREMFPGLAGINEAYKDLQDNSFQTNLKSLGATWTAFTEAFSKATTPTAIGLVHGLVEAIQKLTETVVAHPELARGVALIAGSIAAIATIEGLVKVGSALLGIGAAIRGLPAAAEMEAAGKGMRIFGRGISRLLWEITAAAAVIDGLNALHRWLDPDDKWRGQAPSVGMPQTAPGFGAGGSGSGANGMIDPAHPGHLVRPPRDNSVGPWHASYDGAPVHVVVVNAHDIGQGVMGGLTRVASREPSGPTSPSFRATMPWSGYALAT